ncbi:MAG: sigma-54-dependent Fis family transcriptional regulator [Candidatus Riflebacteria bacterium]|nr:sigma-54-dependent Fis family transcriptional regulator [Candidatus Riflebacteria bacterium]
MESQIIGGSQAIRDVLALIEKVAASDVTVLITGESGTGKEMVAEAIVRSGSRCGKPFIKMNCAAIPSELLESQMFGHERGAFTGAVARQEGCFERANHGVLFLDEIADMALVTQTKVLRVLQEQVFERIGGKDTLHVDVRILAATNKDLLEEIRRGRFREDLYYRLNVIEIRMPPLRDRMEDLRPIVDFFLETFSRKYRKPGMKIGNEGYHTLEEYTWPGNIRELRNIMERAVVLARTDIIGPEDFPEKLRALSLVSTDLLKGVDILTLADMEKMYVRKVLDFTAGNKLQAARLLDIDPKTLRAKLGNG